MGNPRRIQHIHRSTSILTLNVMAQSLKKRGKTLIRKLHTHFFLLTTMWTSADPSIYYLPTWGLDTVKSHKENRDSFLSFLFAQPNLACSHPSNSLRDPCLAHPETPAALHRPCPCCYTNISPAAPPPACPSLFPSYYCPSLDCCSTLRSLLPDCRFLN